VRQVALAAICFAAAAFAGEPLSPLAIVPSPDARSLYVAEFTARQVAVFDVASRRVSRTIALPDRPSGLTLSADGARLYVTGGIGTGHVHIIDAGAGRVTRSIAVGHSPTAPVLAADGKTLYVCDRFGAAVDVVDLASATVTKRIPVVREPGAAVLSGDGARLFVANMLAAGPSTADHVAAEIHVIDTKANRTAAKIRLPDGGVSLRGLCFSPDGRYLYATHVLSRQRLPASQIERGWIQTNALTVIDARELRPVNTVLLDDINLGAANPWGVACTGDGKHLAIAHAGTHEISVIDRPALHGRLEGAAAGARVTDVSVSSAAVPDDMAFLTGIRTRVPLAGNGPRGVAIVGSTVYAAEYFSGSLGVLDLDLGRPLEARSVPLGPAAEINLERRGEMLFHDAQYCYQKWLSCSSCHPGDARPDGLNWDLMLDGVGNAKNTKSLMLAWKTPPTTWTGARPDYHASVRAGFRTIEFASRPEADIQAIEAWLRSLEPMPSPVLESGALSAAAARGKRVFERAGCAGCHSGPLYTDLRQHDSGTGRGREKGVRFDTPTLIEVWSTAPYLHDGRAATLKSLFTSPDLPAPHGLGSRFKAKEIDDLIAFVSSL
jgi:DNA-binding beta-propeller fold protein YncE